MPPDPTPPPRGAAAPLHRGAVPKSSPPKHPPYAGGAGGVGTEPRAQDRRPSRPPKPQNAPLRNTPPTQGGQGGPAQSPEHKRDARPAPPAREAVRTWPTIPDLDAPPFIGRLLRRRGVANAAEAERFLNPSETAPDAPLPGLDRAVERILRARHERRAARPYAVVYGDYDVDGVAATVILYEALDKLGITCRPFIPNRYRDGYGIHERWLRQFAAEGATLIITADCGITALDTIRDAHDRFDLDFVVVDHHAPGPELPDVAALVAPHTEPGAHPLAELSTGGLAWHLAHALMRAADIQVPPDHWLDLAALSTIADVVPLRGENRRIVAAGLETMRALERPGIAALAKIARVQAPQIDAETVSFQFAPRINAAGRIDDAELAVELLSVAPERAYRANDLAAELDELNTKRRQHSDEAFNRALQQVEALAQHAQNTPNAQLPLVLLAGDDQTLQGVIGIVAGRLADRYQRPAFAYTHDDNIAHASGRGPAPFDLAAMLNDADDLLLRHGGHARAAAFTAETQHLPQLLQRLNQSAEATLENTATPAIGEDGLPSAQQDGRTWSPQPTLEIDGKVSLAAVTPAHIHWLNRLAPFGAANPPPTFLSTNIHVAESRRIGKDKSHLRLTLTPRHPEWRTRTWPAIAWRQAESAQHAAPGAQIDIVWTIRQDRNNRPELEIQDLAPTT